MNANYRLRFKNQKDWDYIYADLVTGKVTFLHNGHESSARLSEWESMDDIEIEALLPFPSTTSSGGPSSYYDFPYKDWVTGNDQIEYLAVNNWKEFSCHFKDIFKACLRWGRKDGTTKEYDAKKIIYSGLRLLGMVTSKDNVKNFIKELSEDVQFK